MNGCQWIWEGQSKTFGDYGNANQWTVNAGLASLARESCQNSNDARSGDLADLVYTFITLRGEARAEFEAAIAWNEVLKPHLEAMALGAAGAVAAGQIRAGLDLLERSPALLLLRIEDYGCRGLTGPEFPSADLDESDYGNFIKLCRLNLFSGKDQAAGGSFGLGKAVYWRFSALQTVLFNSTVPAGEGVGEQHRNRVFGVNQGTVHRLGGSAFQGRGFFGVPDAEGAAQSVWASDELVSRLHLQRDDERPGTSALLLAFHDPDDPQGEDESPEAFVARLSAQLRAGIEESFWPLLTRGRMRVRIDEQVDGALISSVQVDPQETYTELVLALRRFDKGDFDAELLNPYDVICRDIPIDVSRRKSLPEHEPFTHTAKLVITLSDENADSLENRVCLFRRPEMVVQTIDRRFEGRNYHGFLVAGGAVNPAAPGTPERLADDFLRFAEPPAHDRWIPGSGRHQASQVNLTAHYSPPWLPNLREIEKRVAESLEQLFEVAPNPEGKAPESVLRHLRFLRSSDEGRGARGGAGRKPSLEIVSWQVEDGAWVVSVEVRAPNRKQGWSLQPTLVLVGLDGERVPVAWDGGLTADSGCEVSSERVLMPAQSKGRILTARFRGRSVDALPIPADLSVVDVLPGQIEAFADGGAT